MSETKQILDSIIKDFSIERFNLFFRRKTQGKFREINQSYQHYDDSDFKNSSKLGEAEFGDGKLLVCSFEVQKSEAQKDLSERSGKKAQYEKAKSILKSPENQVYSAGIFVFYDKKGNFRFSLVYPESIGTKRQWSHFKRFTYFVSQEFTNKTFLQRIGDGDFSTLAKIKEAFSVEKVTKEFYQDIANWYFWAVSHCQFPKDAEKSPDRKDNISVIRLITRMIFIWFMRVKELINKDLFEKQQIQDILKNLNNDESSYYKAILQNLFFATLSTKKEERQFASEERFNKGWNKDYDIQYVFRYQEMFKNPENIKDYFGDIPFLNGGLFECLDDKKNGIIIDGFSRTKKNQPEVPNFLFFSSEKKVDLNKAYGTKNKTYKVRGLLDILSSFNFTIDENSPDDADIALDPELLGRVFENLLASFNPETSTTARKATGSYYTPREIVDYMVAESLKAYFKTHLTDVEKIDEKLEQLFSNESSENPFDENQSKKLVDLIESVKIVDPAVGSGAFPMGALNKLVFILKKVDPENKLWKDAQLKAVDAIPDPSARRIAKEQIEEFFEGKNADYGRKLYLIQRCIYGVDIQQIAVEIAKLRFFISLLVDEKIDKEKDNWGIEPLPNLDFKIMQGNSLISEFLGIDFDNGKSEQEQGQAGLLFDQEDDSLIKEFEQKKIDFQNEADKDKKAKLKQEVEDLMIRIFETKVKKQKGDYFRQIDEIERKYSTLPNQKQREEIITQEKQKLSKKSGFDLPNIAKQLREFVSKKKTRPFFPWKLYFAEVFEKGGFDVVIGNPPYKEVSERNEKLFFQDKYRDVLSGHYDLFIFFFKKGIELLNKNGINSYITPHTFLVYNQFENLRKWIYNNTSIIEITDRIESVFESAVVDNSISIIIKNPHGFQTKFTKYKYNGNELILCNESVLMKTEYNHEAFVIKSITNKKTLKKFEDNSELLGLVVESSQGITVYAKVQGKKINYFRERKTTKYSKPYTKGREIFKYTHQWAGGYIEYGDWLWCPRDTKYFENPKIFLRQTSADIIATYIEEPFYAIDSVHSLVKKPNGPDLKYVLAILNSTFGNYLYHLLISEEGKVFAQVKLTFLRKIPIKKASQQTQQPFIALVDKILAITKGDDYLQNPDKQAKVKEYEKQIDELVYKLYELTPEEIAIVEGKEK